MAPTPFITVILHAASRVRGFSVVVTQRQNQRVGVQFCPHGHRPSPVQVEDTVYVAVEVFPARVLLATYAGGVWVYGWWRVAGERVVFEGPAQESPEITEYLPWVGLTR